MEYKKYEEPWRNWTPTLDRNVYQNLDHHFAVKVNNDEIKIKDHQFDFLTEEANAKFQEVMQLAVVCEYMSLIDEYQQNMEELTEIFINPNSFTETAPGFDFNYDGRLIDIQYYLRDTETKSFDARHILIFIDADVIVYTDQLVLSRRDTKADKTYWRNLIVNGQKIEQADVDEKFIQNYMNIINQFPMNPLR